MPRLRHLWLIGLLVAALGAGPGAAEEGYPSRLVKVIVPFPPGSTLDALARVMTDQMAQRWGQPVSEAHRNFPVLAATAGRLGKRLLVYPAA
jgi:tripartite-type tricarboxylate transporter receptor subunit TctC